MAMVAIGVMYWHCMASRGTEVAGVGFQPARTGQPAGPTLGDGGGCW